MLWELLRGPEENNARKEKENPSFADNGGGRCRGSSVDDKLDTMMELCRNTSASFGCRELFSRRARQGLDPATCLPQYYLVTDRTS